MTVSGHDKGAEDGSTDSSVSDERADEGATDGLLDWMVDGLVLGVAGGSVKNGDGAIVPESVGEVVGLAVNTDGETLVSEGEAVRLAVDGDGALLPTSVGDAIGLTVDAVGALLAPVGASDVEYAGAGDSLGVEVISDGVAVGDPQCGVDPALLGD